MAAFGIFFNQGEVCSANSRLLVERSIRDESRRARRAGAVGASATRSIPRRRWGRWSTRDTPTACFGYIEAAARAGDLRHGGERVAVNGHDRCFVAPTVIDGSERRPLAQEEIFGPVLAVIDFEYEYEALRLANATRYGLAASIWTSNLGRAHRLARRLRAGTVSVNTVDALGPRRPSGASSSRASGAISRCTRSTSTRA